MNIPAILAWVQKNLLIVGVVCVVLFVGIWWYATKQGVISHGNTIEAELSSSYGDGANYLSNCVVKTHQAANVATANAAAFDKVIKDAIAGTGDAQHVNLNSATGKSAFLPILVQAYPDLKGQTDLFNKVVNVIVGCQDDFRNKQSVVQDKVRAFNTWRTGSWKVRTFGGNSFPNDNLVIEIPGVHSVTGKAALSKMRQPIVDSVTSTSYQTGQQSADNPFSTPSPSPTQ